VETALTHSPVVLPRKERNVATDFPLRQTHRSPFGGFSRIPREGWRDVIGDDAYRARAARRSSRGPSPLPPSPPAEK
jgi:hypothetical protein